MKFNFKIQQYQTDAVDAVVKVFSGQGFHDKISYIRDLGKMKSKDDADRHWDFQMKRCNCMTRQTIPDIRMNWWSFRMNNFCNNIQTLQTSE